MRIIKPYFIIETPIDGENRIRILKMIESAARTCYKSEHKITSNSAADFVKRIVQVKKHESVIEHCGVTVRFIANRGFSHELVRHRLAAYSQESTRYCNYENENFGKEITVIEPVFFQIGTENYNYWKIGCENAETAYFNLIRGGAKPQEAREVLPNSLKTEIVATYNLRVWKHVFSLRTSPAAHPEMRRLMVPLQLEFQKNLPEIFGEPIS